MKTLRQAMAIGIGAIATFGAVCLTARSEGNASGRWDSSQFYRPNELSIDLFGSGSIGQQTIDSFSGSRVTEDVRLGAGVGINCFFTRHFGLGGEAYTENTADHLVDSASLNLLCRFPIGESGLAPYLLGGGGYQFDVIEQWLVNAGAGLEFRFHKNWGLFFDARYVFAEETENYGVGRAGVRLSF